MCNMNKVRIRMNERGKVDIFMVDSDGNESQLEGVLYAAVTITPKGPPTALLKLPVDHINLEAEVEA